MEGCAGWRVVQGGGLCRREGCAGWRVVQDGGLCRMEGCAGWRVVQEPTSHQIFKVSALFSFYIILCYKMIVCQMK
jgi:hypothetical protein